MNRRVAVFFHFLSPPRLGHRARLAVVPLICGSAARPQVSVLAVPMLYVLHPIKGRDRAAMEERQTVPQNAVSVVLTSDLTHCEAGNSVAQRAALRPRAKVDRRACSCNRNTFFRPNTPTFRLFQPASHFMAFKAFGSSISSVVEAILRWRVCQLCIVTVVGVFRGVLKSHRDTRSDFAGVRVMEPGSAFRVGGAPSGRLKQLAMAMAMTGLGDSA